MRGFRRIAPTAAILVLVVCVGISFGRVEAASCGWFEYRNPVHGFRICVPADLTVSEEAESLVVQGAVVSFGSTFDRSIRTDGSRTNLHDVRVAIGVIDVNSADGKIVQQTARHGDTTIVRGIEFTVYRNVEGAVGNRYETLSYVTFVEGRRFEIALFLHDSDPDCYGPGQVVLFDREAIHEWFETMICSFSVL